MLEPDHHRHHEQQRERHQLGLERARGPQEVGRLAILKNGAPAGGLGWEGIAWPVCWMRYLAGF